ncbi:MAG TPA: DUF6677 family protein [Isosphaeraceae bacterium]|jgi:hypothetical protein
MAQPPPVALRNPKTAALLAWLVPGLGHFYQGRTGKGILYALCILGLYGVGLALGEGHNVYWRWINPLHDAEQFRFSFICQVFVGLPSLPALIQATLLHYGHAPILGGLMAEPPQNVIFGLHARLGKLVEVGSVYTMVAGLLNVLAIYDAYEGPAYLDDESESDPATQASPQELSVEARA